VATQYEVHLLETGRIFDFDAFRPVLRVAVPVMRAEARTDFIDIEEESLGGDPPHDPYRFLAKAAHNLGAHFLRAEQFQLRRHCILLDRTIGILLLERRMRHRVHLVTAGTILTAALSPGSAAPNYPVQPIRFIVTTAPGGGLDSFARLVAAELTPRAGQQ